MRKSLIISLTLTFISLIVLILILQNYLIARNLKNDVEKYLAQSINGEVIDEKLPINIINNLENINSKINKIDLRVLKPYQIISNDILVVVKKLIEQDQKYLVVLQNSEELRATGGFMGSYFVLETKNGQIIPPKIQDVYVPDGQFQGVVEAPKGVQEYLSSGKGWRLPDANWWPNFPDSAKQILFFIETVESEKYNGVIALNLHLIEDLLRLTGEIYLPDYKQSINHENFAQVARADRTSFFPGSQEKINFLNHFLTIFKIELTKVITENPKELLALVTKAVKHKDIQIYNQDSELAEITHRYQVTGEMQKIDRGLAYFLVESNVGINKANRLVERQVEINLEGNQERIQVKWQNLNSFPYINYQRLYTNPQTEILSIKLNEQIIEKFDQRIASINNQDWLEIGFLVPVLSKDQAKIELILKSQLEVNEKNNVMLYKQSGLRRINYKISSPRSTKEIQLLSDLSLEID